MAEPVHHLSAPQELGVDQLMSVAEAIAVIDATVVTAAGPAPLRTGAAAPREQRVLDHDVFADRDYPPFDKALVDGYAVRAGDLATAPTRLRLIGEVAAGAAFDGAIAPGECVAIMTGAPIPPDADAVVMIEETADAGDGFVRFERTIKPGRSIGRRGSDVAAGTILLRRGRAIGPAQVGVLAQVGDSTAMRASDNEPAHGLRAHVLVTGDEIVSTDAVPGPRQIRDANGPMIAALLRSLGVGHVTTSHVRDDAALVRTEIGRLAREHDLLFISGGMSMGKYDHVPATLRALGFDLRITKLRIKPGKPFVFAVRSGGGTRRDQFVFGLPGNPVSGFCCTLRLASRLIARLRGERVADDLALLPLAASVAANGPREFYQPARVERGSVVPLLWKGSADVFTLAQADCLIVRAADDVERRAGDAVPVIPIPS